MKDYLYKRGKHYHYNRRTPKSLLRHPITGQCHPKYADRQIIRVSLQTDSKSDAEMRSRALSYEIDVDLKDWVLCPESVSKCGQETETEDRGSRFGRPATERSAKALSNIFEIRDLKLRQLSQDGKDSPKSTYGKVRRAVEWWLSRAPSKYDLDEIKRIHVSDILANEREHGALANSTLGGFLIQLKGLWDLAELHEAVSGKNPFAKHHLPDTRLHYSPFTADEVNAIYRHADDVETRVAIHTLATTGMRISELCDIRIINDPEHGMLYGIKLDGSGKTASSTRRLPVHPSLQPFFADYQAGYFNAKRIQRKLKSLVQEVIGAEPVDMLTGSVRKLSSHSFRSYVTTELAKTGANMHFMADYTGHESRRSPGALGNATYTGKASIDDLKRLMRMLPEIS